jgi:MFS family permease
MSNQNAWDNVGFGIYDNSLTIKKNVGHESSSWEQFLTIMSVLAGILALGTLSVFHFLLLPTEPLKKDLGMAFWLPIVSLLVYGGSYGKMTFTGETKKFWQYTRLYFFAIFAFGIGLLFFYRFPISGWWFWLSFIFFGLGVACFYISGVRWFEHKDLVYQFNWKYLGDGQKFLIIQNGTDVMLYELKDKINKFEYEKIIQQRKTQPLKEMP